LNSISLPALLFGAEAAMDDKAETTKLCKAYNRACAKIFSTYDSNIIKCCQYFNGYIPLELAIDQRKILFAFSILKHTDVRLGQIFSCFDVDMFYLKIMVCCSVIIQKPLGLKLFKTLKKPSKNDLI